MKEKRCIYCKKMLIVEDNFTKDVSKTSGFKSYCKKCASERTRKFIVSKGLDYSKNKRLKENYGISLDDYNQIFNKQQGCCLICKRHQSEFKKALAVDHCHTTGKIRSLLCNRCNTAIGLALENIKILENMILYLKLHNPEVVPQTFKTDLNNKRN